MIGRLGHGGARAAGSGVQGRWAVAGGSRIASVRRSTVGFNATRRYRDAKTADIVLLVVGILLIGGLVLWGAGVIF